MPDYDFRTLSPEDFEILVRDLLAAEHGWQLEAFGRGQDGGVDLRGRVDDAKLVVQCKHYAGSTFADLRTSAKKEVAKIGKEKPARYLFVTSQILSRTQKDTLVEDLSPWIAQPTDILTRLELNEFLGRHRNVERQHFKLWLASAGILEQIVQSGQWARSEALLEDVTDRLRLYVPTRAYELALKILTEGHVVVLTGVPGVGKSMLAEMLLLAHWHEGWRVVSVSSDIDEAWGVFRRVERQIFLYDDFLGQTDVSERSTKNEDSRIIRFIERVAADPAKRFVMTSRSQILRQAEIVSEPIARGRLETREMVLELTEYGRQERARILYNHLYFSQLPRTVIREYVEGRRYFEVVDHPNFSPRIVEQVLKREFTTGEDLALALRATHDRPIGLWGTMFSTVLSRVAQRIVLTLATLPTGGVSLEVLKRATLEDAHPIEYTNALKALEGTFIKIAKTSPSASGAASFADPSVRDFVLATLDDEPQLVLDLVSRAVALNQIGALLSYAAARSNGLVRFPGLVQVMKEKQDAVARRIEWILSAVERESSNAEYPKRHTISDALEPLVAMLPQSFEVVPGVAHDLLEMALVLAIETVPGWSNAHLYEQLALASIESPGWDVAGVKQLMADVIDLWGAALVGDEDVSTFVDFVQTNQEILGPEYDLTLVVRNHAQRALRNELDNMSMNRNDLDVDMEWLASVERLAARTGLADVLEEGIEWERQRIEEYYAERESVTQPTSGAGVGSVVQKTELVDRFSIEALFEQLT